jgi:hypothetical protein
VQLVRVVVTDAILDQVDPRAASAEYLPIVGPIGCKSLVGALQQDGGVRQPSGTRLVMYFVAMKQILEPVAPEGGFSQATTTPLRCIPARVQLGDVLAKVMHALELREFRATGHLLLPLVGFRADFHKLQQQTAQMHSPYDA